MNLATLERRVRTLETISTRLRLDKQCSSRSGQQTNYGTASWLGELEELTQEAKLITEEAKTAGDPRTALASIRVRCCIVELAAKLCGDLDERSQMNILNLNLDSDAARRIAVTYLERHRPLEVESK
jgi:hypothetical protein